MRDRSQGRRKKGKTEVRDRAKVGGERKTEVRDRAKVGGRKERQR